MLKLFYNQDDDIEVGIDEVGRGCLAGRVYAAAVIWPRRMSNDDWHMIKDSKKLSHKKRKIVEEYIKSTAVDYAIGYVDEQYIDKYNILNASYQAMHNALNNLRVTPEMIIVDGNRFKTYISKDMDFIPHCCVKQGDNKYVSIAAASILAKVARDEYIMDLVKENPKLEKYGWLKNKSYGTKQHMDAIKKYGITQWHRKSFAPCQIE